MRPPRSNLRQWSALFQFLSVFTLMLSHHFGADAAWQPPNIVFILVDDLGWDDVGFHGSEIKTPNIDKLAYEGVILNNYYVQPMCTPTRAALLTGKYPIHTGLQHYVIAGTQPYGLPLSEKTLPQYLRDLGYSTHTVGKWHLGMCSVDYLPENRGFDTAYGYYMGHSDFFDHHSEDDSYFGYDLHYNGETVWNETEVYATELYTSKAEALIKEHDQSKPLFLYLAHQAVHAGNSNDHIQAPQHYIDRFPEINNLKRRLFAGVVSALDDSVGVIVKALQDSGMADNTIIVLSTDNGGPTNGYDGNAACNWPLRGNKNTLWQGGTRGVGLINSPLLEKSGYVNNGMMHVVDWLPTLLHAASGPEYKSSPKLDSEESVGISGVESISVHEEAGQIVKTGSLRKELADLDGFDLWSEISTGNSTDPWPRYEVLLNIDPTYNDGAIIVGEFKLIYGQQPGGNGWYPPPTATETIYPELLNVEGKGRSPTKLKEGEVLDLGIDKNMKTIQFPQTRSDESSHQRTHLRTHGAAFHSYHGNEPIIIDCGDKPTNTTYDCDPTKAPCLFNITADPCEFYNLASELPSVVEDLQTVLDEYNATMIPPANVPDDPAGNPNLHGGVWLPWL